MFLQSSISFAQGNENSWDYSLGSEYGKSAYTPLKKIESEVYHFPYMAPQQAGDIVSPMGSDFYLYIMPESIFGIETIELEFEEGVSEIEHAVDVARIAREIEEALPLILKDAANRQREDLPAHKYGLRIKVQTKEDVFISEEEKTEQDIQEESKTPEEREIDVLISIIFGQNKIVIKIPPLKDPKEKERLIKELERVAHILARQDYLIDINQVSD
ncbi:MAG: hypothetical protein P9X27_00080 [Candidatus Kaelpia aquatica]|nr:hypothetical protein [Candidatus Kaelpia aquatica]